MDATRRFAWGLVALALFLTIASCAFAGGPEQTTAPADPTGGLLGWADALARYGWVGVAMLAVVLGFAAYVLKLRQSGQRQTVAAAVRAALESIKKVGK